MQLTKSFENRATRIARNSEITGSDMLAEQLLRSLSQFVGAKVYSFFNPATFFEIKQFRKTLMKAL